MRLILTFFAITLLSFAAEAQNTSSMYDSDQIAKRLEELAKDHLDLLSPQRVLPGFAFESLSNDEQLLIERKWQVESERAAEKEAQIQIRNTILDRAGGTGTIDGEATDAVNRSLRGLEAIYRAGLVAEKLDPALINKALSDYRFHLYEIATQFQNSRPNASNEKIMQVLAMVFANSYGQAMVAYSKGDAEATEQYIAIAMRVLTEAYLQAGLNNGSRENRSRVLNKIAYTFVSGSMISILAATFLSGPFWHALVMPSAVSFITSLVVLGINRYDILNSTEPTFLKDILKKLDQKTLAKRRLREFWLFASREMNSLTFTRVAQATRIANLKNWATQRESSQEYLNLVTDHFVEMTKKPLSSIVSRTRSTTENLQRCDYKMYLF